jgi:hypothetical protein
MESNHWKSMSIDELWNLHQELAAVLSDRIAAEQARLEKRLRKVELKPRLLSAQLQSGKKLDDFLIG